MTHWAVTGSTGFIGRSVLQRLSELNTASSLDVPPCKVLGVSRRPPAVPIPGVHYTQLGDLSAYIDFAPVLIGVDVLVHTAARAHVMADTATNPLDEFRLVNVQGTIRLAQHAAEAGVQRFVFLSSIGVNGNQTTVPFNEAATPQPHDAYAVSKLEAEHALLALASQTGMEVVIIRPPLVYGPGAPGNFASLVRWVQRGIPLPLGALHNQRSFVALDNLVSLVLLCGDRARSPLAANQVFVVADGEDVSTSTLLRKVARAAGRPSRLLPVPAGWLRAGASLLGKRAVADRLLGNLQVDATKARTLLGWQPVVTMDEQFDKMFEYKY
jgi:nucleoside-diphosphate-sugar epimerase